MKLDIEGIETLAATDRDQVLTTLGALFGGFAARDADMLAGVYSDDADWVNAFGSMKKGSPQGLCAKTRSAARTGNCRYAAR